ncbi:MAG: hypothetical protein WHS82_04985 [Candidatus Methanosuratincola sp.]
MTTFLLDSTVCNHKSRVVATFDAGAILFAVESSCPLVKEFARALSSSPLKVRDITKKICENPIYIKATENSLHPNCIVPCGVAMCAWTEAGLVSKTLLERFPAQCVRYEKGGGREIDLSKS